MIDSNSLSEFVKAPDANEIMTAFVSIPAGPVRAALVSHLATMAMVSLGEAPPAPEAPFMSETPENRVVERRLRGQTVNEIAQAEDMDADRVRELLVAAKAEGVQVGRIEGLKRKSPAPPVGQSQKEKMTTKDRQARRRLSVAFRMLGMGPSQIAKRIGISPSNVSGAIWEEKRDNGTVFPPVNDALKWDTVLENDPMKNEPQPAPPMLEADQVQAS